MRRHVTAPDARTSPSPRLLPWQSERWRTIVLAGIALLSLWLRVYRLDYQSLWRDEVDAAIFAARSLGELVAMFGQVGENGPLFFLSLHAWIGLAGQSEFALRLPSAFFDVLAVLLTYRLGRELLSEHIGLLGALVMAVSPYHIWYGQEAKMYALVSFLAPLSLLILLRALKGGRRWLWLAWAGVMAAFLYVHFFAALMGLVAVAWLPLLVRSKPRLTPALVLAAGLVVLAGLPVARWLIPAALTPVETGYYRYGLGQMVVILIFSFSMGLRPAAGLWPIALFALLLMLGCVPLVVRHPPPGGLWPRRRGVLLLVVYLVVPVLAVWLVSLRRPTFTDRYLIMILPAFYLLMASGMAVAGQAVARVLGAAWGGKAGAQAETLSQTPATKPRRRRVSAMLDRQEQDASRSAEGASLTPAPGTARSDQVACWLAAGLAIIAVLASLPFAWAQTHNPYKADFRAAAHYISQQEQPQDLFVFLMPYAQRGFAYYHPQPVQSVEPPYTRGMSQAQVDAAMHSLVAGNKKVWLFLSEQEFWDADGLIPAWFERNGILRCRQEFAYITVRCYEMK